MPLVVPGTGFSLFESALGASTVFRTLGPFPGGVYLDKLSVLVVSDSNVIERTASLGCVVGSSPVAAASSFGAGVSVLSRSNISVQGQPAVQFVLGAIASFVFDLYIGVLVREGANSLILQMTNSDPDATVDFLASLRTFRVREEVSRTVSSAV